MVIGLKIKSNKTWKPGNLEENLEENLEGNLE